MYNYMFFGYVAYSIYAYSSIFSYAYYVGKGVIRVYKLFYTKQGEDVNMKDLDWVLISEDSDNILKKTYKN